MAHSKMLGDLLHVFEVKECIKTGFVCSNNKKEIRHLLKFYCKPPSKHHGTPAGAQVPTEPTELDGVCAVPQNCNAAVSPSNGTAMTGGQADKQQSSLQCPGKQGLAAPGYSKHSQRTTCVNVTVHVGCEDMSKDQLSPPDHYTYCCSHVEGTCSPAQHPGNGHPITQCSCSKSARALQCVGWTYFHLSTLALPFKGCWNGQGHAMCSLSCRPLSFHPGMTSSQLHARPATPHAQKQIPRTIAFSGSWECKGLRLRPMSWYVRMTGLFPLGVPRMVT